jgi:hypothetical protein
MTINQEIAKMEEELKNLNHNFYMLKNTVDLMEQHIANEVGAYHAVFQLKDKIDNLKKEIERKKEAGKQPIRFLQHFVTNGVDKVKVYYYGSVNKKNELVQIEVYAKEYSGDLTKIFPNVINDTDIMTDYFEKDRVKFDSSSKHWKACKAAYNKVQAANKKRAEKRMAKR